MLSTEDEAAVYNAILTGKGDTVDDISRSTGLSQSKIKRTALKLKEMNLADREGNERNGKYVIIPQNDLQ